MNGPGEVDTAARILDSVVEIIEADGYDAVQLRTVAKRARVSLTTVYSLYSSRDELIVAAVAAWMAAHSYDELALHPRAGTGWTARGSRPSCPPPRTYWPGWTAITSPISHWSWSISATRWSADWSTGRPACPRSCPRCTG
ncbi:TetR/AcrR family transcriptional regulator [Nocardia sp. NPDC002869]|uniref:TetR/AcrR family transcriptional regulator n=1 Tax=Nocardia sp. NPDC002869 TaxID=3161032 RepID=UPI00398D5875